MCVQVSGVDRLQIQSGISVEVYVAAVDLNLAIQTVICVLQGDVAAGGEAGHAIDRHLRGLHDVAAAGQRQITAGLHPCQLQVAGSHADIVADQQQGVVEAVAGIFDDDIAAVAYQCTRAIGEDAPRYLHHIADIAGQHHLSAGDIGPYRHAVTALQHHGVSGEGSVGVQLAARGTGQQRATRKIDRIAGQHQVAVCLE